MSPKHILNGIKRRFQLRIKSESIVTLLSYLSRLTHNFYLFICSLFTKDIDNNPDWRGHGPISGTISAFVWRDLWKPWKPCQDSQCPGRDMKWPFPEYMLLFDRTCVVATMKHQTCPQTRDILMYHTINRIWNSKFLRFTHFKVCYAFCSKHKRMRDLI
jgi:hypothetical protein